MRVCVPRMWVSRTRHLTGILFLPCMYLCETYQSARVYMYMSVAMCRCVCALTYELELWEGSLGVHVHLCEQQAVCV